MTIIACIVLAALLMAYSLAELVAFLPRRPTC